MLLKIDNVAIQLSLKSYELLPNTSWRFLRLRFDFLIIGSVRYYLSFQEQFYINFI